MIVLFYIFALASAVVIQTVISGYFHTWLGARPDALLLVTLYIGIKRGGESGLVTGFFLGLLKDILSGGLLGANALSKGLLGFLTGKVVRNIARGNWVFLASIGFFATAIDSFLWATLSVVFQPDLGIANDYWFSSMKTIVLNAALAPFIIHLLSLAEARMISSSFSVPYPDRP
ncbi:MAG: rod shape-determining protein MreD [bacterium]